MPDIDDLLSGAAPEPPPFDEDDIRRRVERRRRNRRALAGAAAVLAVVAATGIVLATRDSDDDVAVTSRPSTSTSTSTPTTATSAAPTQGLGAYAAVAIVGGDVWAGGNGFVARGDGTDRIDVPGQVLSIVAGVDDGVVWARGDTWVVAIDVASASHPDGTTTPPQLVGSWDGGAAIGDIVALPSREVAISLPNANEVVIAKTSAIAELEEVWRIPVRTDPDDLVRTTGGDVWVTCSDGISELDVGAQGVKRTEDWRGPLLAPSLSGGIWTVEGHRVIDLHPENLQAGLSVAEGTRYDVRATAVTETSYGLYVAGPDGLTRHDPDHADPEVIDPNEPSALSADGGQVVYVVDGVIRTAQARG